MLICLIRLFSYSVCFTPSYASKADFNDLNVDQEPEPESRSFADIYTELIDEIRKLVTSQTAKVNASSEPNVVDKSETETEVVDGLK